MSVKERGFSLMEMMVSMAVLLLIVGGVFQLLNQSQQRYVSTSTVEETTAMARETVDQMVREIRLAGYPAQNSYPASLNLTYLNSGFVAGGILVANPYSIRFEADTDNTGLVTVFEYELQAPSGAPPGCGGWGVNNTLSSTTLMRSAQPKPEGGGVPAPVFEPFLGNVLNCNLSIPIFIYCPAPPAAAPAGCPTMPQTSSNLPAPRNTRIVMVNLQVQTPVRDPQTGVFQNVELLGLAHRINPDQ